MGIKKYKTSPIVVLCLFDVFVAEKRFLKFTIRNNSRDLSIRQIGRHSYCLRQFKSVYRLTKTRMLEKEVTFVDFVVGYSVIGRFTNAN